MNTLLLWLALFAQGIPPLPNQGGTVVGVVKSADGSPASHVRVVAMIPPESPGDVAAVASLATLTETDENGRYHLDNVPLGRYLIAAGRIDAMTYYPGFPEVAKATKVMVTAGDTLTGINFTLSGSSAGRASNSLVTSVPSADVPFQVIGVKVPISFPGGSPQLVLTNVRDGQRTIAALNSPSINLKQAPGTVGANQSYTVSIENLPVGYSVKSMMSGSVDLMQKPLEVPAGRFSTAISTTLSFQSVSQQLQSLISGLLVPPSTPPSAPTPLSIVVELNHPAPQAPASGIRVSGKFNGIIGTRTIFISNIQGTTYADGTFEFAGVPPGRHVITSRNNSAAAKPLGAVVVTGDRDIDGIAVEEFWVLPMDFASQSQTATPAGTKLSFPSVSGRVVEETTGAAINQGIVYFSGQERISFRLQPDGTFQIPRLLPGNYKIEIQVFGHINVSRDLVIEDEDLHIEFRSASIDAQ